MANDEPELSNPLPLDFSFPDAFPIFEWQPAEVAEVLKQGLIVLDTNALLLPYTVGAKSLKQIDEGLSKLTSEGRLLIPGQVAREFAKNRPLRISELYKQVSDKKSKALKLDLGRYPLLATIIEYENAKETEIEINALLKTYHSHVDALIKNIESWNWNDPVSMLYRRILHSNTIADFDFDLQEIRAEFAYRTTHKIPPGYKDASKTENELGDFLIWRTILELGKTRKQDLAFVTSDTKSDWSHRSDSSALFARYELVDEFRRSSDGHTFHLANFYELLDALGADSETVNEVRVEELESNRTDWRISGTFFTPVGNDDEEISFGYALDTGDLDWQGFQHLLMADGLTRYCSTFEQKLRIRAWIDERAAPRGFVDSIRIRTYHNGVVRVVIVSNGVVGKEKFSPY